MYADKSLDFVFIDAGHEYEEIKNDIINWGPKLKSGGILAGHDFHYPPVTKAVQELVPNFKVFGNSWIQSYDNMNYNKNFDKAIYGSDTNFIDVTNIFNNIPHNEIEINNYYMKSDPAPYQHKQLKLYYKNKQYIINEGEIVNFNNLQL